MPAKAVAREAPKPALHDASGSFFDNSPGQRPVAVLPAAMHAA